jgi:hypothetical protein
MLMFPGSVSRPAATMVRQIDWSSAVGLLEGRIHGAGLSLLLSLSLASGSFNTLPVMHGLSVPSSILCFSLLRNSSM